MNVQVCTAQAQIALGIETQASGKRVKNRKSLSGGRHAGTLERLEFVTDPEVERGF